ncbi:MAG: DNA helicase RecQ [Bacteroidota bacterium]
MTNTSSLYMLDTKDIHAILKTTFGYDSFRNNQEEIIRHIIDGKDALVIMPTGGGKSICYQIPALTLEGITLVVSPLIALMNDQVLNLEQSGVAAACLHSNMTPEESLGIERRINAGEIKLLYMSPERINHPNTQSYLRSLNVKLIAIDEAHCVSVWGNDFRPDYIEMVKLRAIFTDASFVALTATADQTTQEDICEQLQLDNPTLFLSSFERKNITTYAHPAVKRLDKIASILRDYREECGIIYCLSRKDTEKVSAKLNTMGLNTAFYHAGLDGEERFRVQREFQNDEIKIIVATIAFGMGIDKPNIRFVIHYNMPKNLEAYYQEIGRAGRDGEDSVAHMFASWGDFILLKRFIDNSESKDQFKEIQLAKLERMWEYASTTDCRTNSVLAYFGEYKNENCGHCDNCLNPPVKKNGLIPAQKILSAVWRSKQSVGMELLIDVLRGSQKQEVRDRGLDTIKTFGVGRDLPRLTWKNYIIQLLNKGILAINYKEGSILKWTPLSQAVLKGEQRIDLADFVINEPKKPKAKTPVFNLNVDNSLLGKLKSWRLDEARHRSVPAYVILSNKSIEQIASEKPTTNFELLEINGIGNAKLKLYGASILDIVKNHQ